MAKKQKAAGNDILDELVGATGVNQKAGESVQDYAKRLALAVDKLADDDWRVMSEPAQLWTNDAVAAADVKKEIDELPGMIDAKDDALPDEESDAEAGDALGEIAATADAESEEVEEPAPRPAGKKASVRKDKKDSAAKKSAAAKLDDAKPVGKKARGPEKKAVAKPTPKASGKKVTVVDKKSNKAAASDASGKAKLRKLSAEPRAGTKRAKLIEMLSHTKGATVAEIMKDFGWLSHTVRGALSLQVRSAGYKLVSEQDVKRGRVYRIEV